MKTKSKFLGASLLVALLSLVFAPPARADVGTVDVGITNFFKAQTGYFGAQYATNVIPCDNVDNFDLVLTGSASASATDVITISLAPCLDSSRSLLATNTTYSFAFPLTGATLAVAVRTNIPLSVVGSAGGFAVIQVTNAAASANLTNVSLTVVKKVRKQ